MKKKSIRYGVATIAAATLISAGVMAPSAHAASGTVLDVNSKVITVNMNNIDQLNKVAAQYGIDLNELLSDLKNNKSVTIKKPAANQTTKPSTGTTTKPTTGIVNKPSTGTAKPSTGTTTKPSTGSAKEGSETTTSSNSSFQSQVVELVNKEREAAGLSALKSDTLLTKVAVAKAKDMDENNYFDHTSPTYGSPFDMMAQFGVSYSYAGENIASGQQTPEAVMEAWMNSQGHRENILNKNYTKIGVGYVNGKWVQEFTG